MFPLRKIVGHARISTTRRTVIAMLSIAVIAPAAAFPSLPGLPFSGAYDSFFRAVKLDDARTVQSLLARGVDPNTIEEARGDTGLMLAARENSMKVFDVLLNTPDVNIEARALNGDNALMVACFKGNRAAVQALLDKGAEVNKPGWTPLHYAAAAGDNEIVRLLLDKFAYIDAESPNKTTPLMMAAWRGHIMTVKLLHDEGADATLKNEHGMTAIDFAEQFQHKDIAEGLTYRLKKAGQL